MRRSVLVFSLLVFCFPSFAVEKVQSLNSLSFGDEWPLTFDKAKVSCIDGAYAFVYNAETNERYPLNGLASGSVKKGKMHGSDLNNVWKDDPNSKGLKISISPALDAALTLCK